MDCIRVRISGNSPDRLLVTMNDYKEGYASKIIYKDEAIRIRDQFTKIIEKIKD
ncbi:MAG TPA: hypothetical protein VI911_10750 [Patescibacteria group bacterium]|nr:hypothetical protein [Patescibacteria group bacterium]